MNYCTIDELKKTPLYKPPKQELIYASDGREFTSYIQSNQHLKKFALKHNMELNTNEFREYMQKNPDKIRKYIQEHPN